MLIKILLILLFSLSEVIAGDFEHGISFFGDLKYPRNFSNFDYVNPNAPKGGSIKYGIEGTFNSLNPFILKGISAAGMGMVFDSLMEDSADEISSKYGLIAKAAKIADDNSYVIFRLRHQARFNDGEKIKADDVIFSFQTLINKGHPSYQMIYRDVQDAIKINDYEVKFTFKNKENRNLALALAGLPILPKHYYQKIPFDQTSLLAPLGSGAYAIKSVDPGRSITYERVKNYWAKDLPINKGRHNFDLITYDYYRDNNVLLEAFKAGAYDFRQENIARNWATAYDIATIKNGQIIKKEIKNNLPSPTQAFVFNLRKNKFQNRYLRQAITYAFDFEWVKSKIFYNSYQRTQSYFSNSEFASTEIMSKAEMEILSAFKNYLPKEIFSKEFKLPTTNATGYERANLVVAKRILKEQGYFLKNKKLIDPKTGETIKIEFLIIDKPFVMVIAPMIKNLAKLGIDAKIRLIDENQYQNRVNNFDYDIIVAVFGQGLIPASEQFAYWHKSQKNIIGGQNLAGADDPVVDYLVEKIVKTKNKEKLQLYSKLLDRVLLWNFYTIPQWHNNIYRILYKNKFSMPKNLPPYSLALDSWWARDLN